MEKWKKKERKLRNGNLVAAADKRPPKPNGGPLRDHFEKRLEAPYPYHEGSVKHALKDRNLMKNYLGGASKNKPHDTTKVGATKNVDNDNFPKEDSAIVTTHPGKYRSIT
jgi:hypothetical protein